MNDAAEAMALKHRLYRVLETEIRLLQLASSMVSSAMPSQRVREAVQLARVLQEERRRLSAEFGPASSPPVL